MQKVYKKLCRLFKPKYKQTKIGLNYKINFCKQCGGEIPKRKEQTVKAYSLRKYCGYVCSSLALRKY